MTTTATTKITTLGLKGKHSVLIVDDHPVLRQGLCQLINGERDLMVCGQFEEAGKVLDSIPKLKPDVVLLDISLRGTSGIDLLKSLMGHYPKLKVLVLSMHDEALYAERALRAGAMGYIMKEEATERVFEALRKVLHGEIFLSTKMSAKLMHQYVGRPSPSKSPLDMLSDRELEIFSLIGQGRGTRQIAEQLHLSIKTVESHRAHIKDKLNIRTATELVHCAIQMQNEFPKT